MTLTTCLVLCSSCHCSSEGGGPVSCRGTKSCWGMRSDETYTRDAFFHLPCWTRESLSSAFDKEGIPTSRPAGRVCLSCVGDWLTGGLTRCGGTGSDVGYQRRRRRNFVSPSLSPPPGRGGVSVGSPVVYRQVCLMVVMGGACYVVRGVAGRVPGRLNWEV